MPLIGQEWYARQVSGTQVMTVGHKGRVVIPAEIRRRYGFEEGQKLILVDGPDGPILMTREALRASVHADYAGADLVTKLIASRREEARREHSK